MGAGKGTPGTLGTEGLDWTVVGSFGGLVYCQRTMNSPRVAIGYTAINYAVIH